MWPLKNEGGLVSEVTLYLKSPYIWVGMIVLARSIPREWPESIWINHNEVEKKAFKICFGRNWLITSV